VLDNSITGMTGHQDNPGTGFTLEGEIANKIAIEDVLRSFGFENVIIVDPQDLKAMQKAVDDALASTVPAAIIVRRPCVLIKRIKHDIGKCEVDRDKCRSCKICLKVACPALHMKDGKTEIDQTLCVGCKVCAQTCPFGAISRTGEQKGE
jgi:indolepyruvate ferredoxin oxidoreductase alpha subunit